MIRRTPAADEVDAGGWVAACEEMYAAIRAHGIPDQWRTIAGASALCEETVTCTRADHPTPDRSTAHVGAGSVPAFAPLDLATSDSGLDPEVFAGDAIRAGTAIVRPDYAEEAALFVSHVPAVRSTLTRGGPAHRPLGLTRARGGLSGAGCGTAETLNPKRYGRRAMRARIAVLLLRRANDMRQAAGAFADLVPAPASWGEASSASLTGPRGPIGRLFPTFRPTST